MNIIELFGYEVKAVIDKTKANLHLFKAMGHLYLGNYISQCKTPCTAVSTHKYPSTPLRTLGTGTTTTRTGTTTIRTTTTLCSLPGIK